ncbi:exostosin-2-like [Pollicipes pollicipes]|uniref:exostosin-2-like n=1 Tax=Pollicipes pollicipes TaxID=41117 RepID=UPI0018859117|nr:exostosin-2-like [Pollicipes pollicipes]
MNVYQCGGARRSRIAVYVYPYARYADERGRALVPLSREYLDVLQAVQQSPFYTDDPHEACIFLPAIDTWQDGENHLVFSVWPGTGTERLGRALLAGASLSSLVYRHGFDVSLPTGAEFCLAVRGAHLGPEALADALAVLDWTRIGLHVYEEDLARLPDILAEVSESRRLEMRRQGAWVWRRYLRSFREMALTTLQIVNRPRHVSPAYPLTVPYTAPRSQGFTAVVLTYDRLDSLYQIIETVALAPSLSKVLVVWNNQKKAPPSASLWPTISKPLKVVQTGANLLSNRFYPYDEIETECVLALDDDITMLTVDELEFGYQVWREYPDRIVGFPSRNHVWNNVTQSWGYDSEWTSDLSMVLTGAAFYHKYWNYRYTNSLPGNIKQWVDDNMNCEDIAMNFLVSNVTGKAPIKVAARKKFKCTSADCSGGDLSANVDHFIERSDCIQHFVGAFGAMPLRRVQFRADPVLYRDDFPAKLKRYNDVGSL